MWSSLMEYRVIGDGVSIPVLGVGTWGMGGRQVEDRSRDEEEVQAIRVALDLGMTHIDTAEYYGAGHCEELVGEAIEPYRRGDIFITTKVWRNHLEYDSLLSSMEGSLRRLGVDHVDLYLIHWPNPKVPLRETMSALEKCADEGLTRFIGVSNFSPQLMREAQGYLREHRLVANQVEYSLMDQKPGMELLPYLRSRDSLLVAYKPLGRGSLLNAGNRALAETAERYGKTPAQVALNWVISHEGVVAIPKSSNPLHLLENAGAVGWSLGDEDMALLADSFV
jgi:diketogulonate reductase-like aldo/keto reductase